MTKHKTLTHAHGLRMITRYDAYYFTNSILNREYNTNKVHGPIVKKHRLLW
jgi:hypothetical protein